MEEEVGVSMENNTVTHHQLCDKGATWPQAVVPASHQRDQGRACTDLHPCFPCAEAHPTHLGIHSSS